jgi:sulfur carrier protein ThiS adenylyltransferase
MSRFVESLGRYLSKEELKRVGEVKVGIAGAGGLGSNLAVMLTRTGFRRLKIADFDVVDISNLNRQFYFNKDIGKKKVEALKENLEAIDPELCVEISDLRLNGENMKLFFSDCSMIAEAFDTPEMKRELLSAFAGSSKRVVSVSGIAGYGNADEIITHRINDKFTLIGDLRSGVGKLPPLAPRVMVASAKQADVILEMVLRG